MSQSGGSNAQFNNAAAFRNHLASRVPVIALATATAVADASDDIQTQSATTTVQSFTTVEGADLMARLEAAQARARTRQTPILVCLHLRRAFRRRCRSGNPRISWLDEHVWRHDRICRYNGRRNDCRNTNLAIFLLRDPSSNQITRMEVYNLERKREYSGYPVYWLGRANNEESLNYLRAIAAATPLDMLSERAVLGIALHDDSRVGGMLKNFISSSPNPRIRSSAVYWLGQVGGETTFLATLVRNDAEDKQASTFCGALRLERVKIAAPSPRSRVFMKAVKDLEIRRSVISAAGNSIDEQPAFAFLLNVGKNDADWESRQDSSTPARTL